MRIGILMDRITPGAAPKLLGREVQYLRELGHDAEGISIADLALPEGHPQFEEFLANVPIRYMSEEHSFLRRLNFAIPPFSFFAAFDLAAGYTMAWFLKNDKPRYDVIVAHSSISCWIANKVWRSLGIPYVAYMWDPISFILDDIYRTKMPRLLWSTLMRVGRSLDKRLIDEAIISLAGSDTYARIVERYTGRKVEVLYPAVDVPEAIPEERGDYLFTIDRWDIGCMPTWLLDVLVELSEPIKFKVAGFWWPPSLETEFWQAVKERGLENRVEVLGPVTEQELIKLYRGARALIFPHQDPINMPVMEAAAHGCPIVIQQGIDLFTHGVDSFLPDCGPLKHATGSSADIHRPTDLTKFIDCTDQLVRDERLAFKIGRKASELMKDYSWRHHSQRLNDLIQEGFQRAGT